MLRLADVGKDDVVYDLGCGDGRIVVTAQDGTTMLTYTIAVNRAGAASNNANL